MELFSSAAVSFVTALATNSLKGAKGPAQALDDIMTLVGFEKLHYFAEKKRAHTEIYIRDYKEKIGQEIIKIPDHCLKEPSLSIVGPAIEASKYYIEEEQLRNMFAKLIASSMNSEKSESVHPSFVEVIKQLSSNDAYLLKEVSISPKPAGKIYLELKEATSRSEPDEEATSKNFKGRTLPDLTKLESFPVIDIFYVSSKLNDWEQNSLHISSLQRLGLIEIQSRYLADDNFYNQFLNKYYETITTPDFQELLTDHKDFKYGLEKKSIACTPFGEAFATCCIL